MKFTSVNLLDELAKPEFSSLLSAFHERSFPKNSMIFTPSYDEELESSPTAVSSAGERLVAGNYVFIVSKGLVRVYLAYGEKEFTIAFLKPGDVYVSHSSAQDTGSACRNSIRAPTSPASVASAGRWSRPNAAGGDRTPFAADAAMAAGPATAARSIKAR